MSNLMPPVFSARMVLSGISFTLLSYTLMRILNLVITVLLARALSPEGVGIIAGALLAIELVDSFRDFGVRDALIYHRGSGSLHTTAFIIVMGVSAVQCAGLLIFCWLQLGVASEVAAILPYLSLLFPLNALGTVPEALTQKRLQLFQRGMSDVINATSKLLVTAVFLAAGFGVWSLVYGLLLAACARTIYLFYVAPWQLARPSFQEAIKLASYGRHVALMNVFSPIRNRIDQLLIVYFLGPVTLGPYYIAARIPEVAVTGINTVLTRFLFPSFVLVANEKERLKTAYIVGLRYSSSVMFPVSIGIALTADLSILTLFGAEWLNCVSLLQILALSGIPLTLGWAVGDVLKANGRPQVLTLLTFLDAFAALTFVSCAINFSGNINLIAFAMFMAECVAMTIRSFVIRRNLSVNLSQLASAILPSLLASAGMAACVVSFRNLSLAGPVVELIACVLVGCISYCSLLLVLDRSFRSDLVKLRSGGLQ